MMKIVQAHFALKKTPTFCLPQTLKKKEIPILAYRKMGCLKLPYRPEFLHVWKGTAYEKSDPVNFLPIGEKNEGKEKSDNYYPFGLTFNSYSRENSMPNDYLFNGIERQDELDLGWDLADFRSYNPSLGRWMQIDPKTSERESPYVAMANNPVMYSDPEGDTIKIQRTNGDGYYTYGSGERIGRDRQVRRTVRTLNKIQRRGADKEGVIADLSSRQEITTINPRSDWTDRTSVLAGDNSTVNWSANQGYTSENGEILQSPALGLLHELAEAYYILADPEGRVAENPGYFKGKEYAPGDILKIFELAEIEKRETGNYQTYNDRWIIQNVEPGFNQAFKDENRNTHKGYGTKVGLGPFSKRASKYYNHRTDKIGRIRSLRRR